MTARSTENQPDFAALAEIPLRFRRGGVSIREQHYVDLSAACAAFIIAELGSIWIAPEKGTPP